MKEAPLPDSIYDDIAAFIVAAREQSFVCAAARLGVSQSALSQTIRNLEDRLHMRLLARTTRRVSATDLGRQLRDVAEARLEGLAQDLNRIRDGSD